MLATAVTLALLASASAADGTAVPAEARSFGLTAMGAAACAETEAFCTTTVLPALAEDPKLSAFLAETRAAATRGGPADSDERASSSRATPYSNAVADNYRAAVVATAALRFPERLALGCCLAAGACADDVAAASAASAEASKDASRLAAAEALALAAEAPEAAAKMPAAAPSAPTRSPPTAGARRGAATKPSLCTAARAPPGSRWARCAPARRCWRASRAARGREQRRGVSAGLRERARPPRGRPRGRLGGGGSVPRVARHGRGRAQRAGASQGAPARGRDVARQRGNGEKGGERDIAYVLADALVDGAARVAAAFGGVRRRVFGAPRPRASARARARSSGAGADARASRRGGGC